MVTPQQRSKIQAHRVNNGLCLFCGTPMVTPEALAQELSANGGSPAGRTCSACNNIHFLEADLDRAANALGRATTEAHVITRLKRLIRETARNYHR